MTAGLPIEPPRIVAGKGQVSRPLDKKHGRASSNMGDNILRQRLPETTECLKLMRAGMRVNKRLRFAHVSHPLLYRPQLRELVAVSIVIQAPYLENNMPHARTVLN
ncbi:hypothetical protein MRX96_040406 [Rhipicephalus microplus]